MLNRKKTLDLFYLFFHLAPLEHLIYTIERFG